MKLAEENKVNNRKIAFITCVNDKKAYEECLFYIENLYVPDGYEIETIEINYATSITSGYNEAIDKSDAKYKVYLHQDVLIVNKNFIKEIVSIFSKDSNIGMLGVVGSKDLHNSGIWWKSPHKVGTLYESIVKLKIVDYGNEYDIDEVLAIDGCIMITQYDVRWNEEVFDGWHFYDISQCMEFRRKGYKVCVPKQERILCLHDCGIAGTDYY
nr:glycosyltransferase family protein [Clostridium cibarium]